MPVGPDLQSGLAYGLPKIRGQRVSRACEDHEQLLLEVAPRELVRQLALLVDLEHRVAERELLARHDGHVHHWLDGGLRQRRASSTAQSWMNYCRQKHSVALKANAQSKAASNR